MKISCDVARDLMPLYVDDILSEDSVALVLDHTRECGSCRTELERLAGAQLSDSVAETIDEDISLYDSLRKIRRRMSLRQQLTVLITVAVIVIIGATGWYFYDQYELYLPYDKAEITYRDDMLYSGSTGSSHERILSSDLKTMIVVISTTHRSAHDYKKMRYESVLWNGPKRETTYYDTDDKELVANIDKVYYISESGWKDFEKTDDLLKLGIPTEKLQLDKYDKRFEKIKNSSKLIWTKSDGFVGK